MLNGTIVSLEGKSGVEVAVIDANYRMSILNEYLSELLTKQEVIVISTPLLKVLENPNMGTAMKTVMPSLKGKADGKIIGEVVTEILRSQNL